MGNGQKNCQEVANISIGNEPMTWTETKSSSPWPLRPTSLSFRYTSLRDVQLLGDGTGLVISVIYVPWAQQVPLGIQSDQVQRRSVTRIKVADTRESI